MSANLPACHQDNPQHAAYVARVGELEAEGCDTSDAQGIADIEFDALLTQPKKPTKPTHKPKNKMKNMKTEISNPTGLIYVTVPHTMPPKAYGFCTPADFSDWLKSVNKQVNATTYNRSEWIARAEEAGEEEGSDWWNRWVVPGFTLFDAGSEKITEIWYSETQNEIFDAAEAPNLDQAILQSMDDFNTWTVLDRAGAMKVSKNGWPQPHKSIETTGEVAKACQELGWV